MSFVIALQGIESEKTTRDGKRKVIPFVGADREGEFSQLGLGILLEDGSATIWGLVMPHNVIQSWRGMKLLEELPCVGSGTFCYCWTLMRGDDRRDHEQQYFNELAAQIGTEQLEKRIREIRASVPSSEELEKMLEAFREKGVDVSHWDLKAELDAGRIKTSPLIETILTEAELAQQEYARKEAEIIAPIDPEKSLGAFFQDLGITNLVIDEEDWFDKVDLAKLDALAKRGCFDDAEHNRFKCDVLQDNDALRKEYPPPHYIAWDKAKFTFLSAQFRNGQFWVKTTTEEQGKEPFTGEFTVSELRRSIGPIPSKETLRKRFHRVISQFFKG